MSYEIDELDKILEGMTDESIADMTIEEKMDILDGIIENMESDESTLNESFSLYEKGMKLVASCNEAIDRVEKEVLKLEEDGSLSVFEGE